MNRTGRGLLAIPMPSGDRVFARHLAMLVDRVEPATPAELEDRLREYYPHAEVHPRELSGEVYPTWYVYREPGLPRLEHGWWEQPRAAALRVGRDNRITSVNAGAAALLRTPTDDLVGRDLVTLFAARARRDAAAVLDIIRALGSGESRWRLLRADAEEIDCAYRASAGDAGLDIRLCQAPAMFAPRPVAILRRQDQARSGASR